MVERPMGLPPRVLPPGLGEGKAYATSRQQQKPSDDPLFEIEWGEAHHERKVMAMEAEAREAEERRKAADKVEQAEAWELQKKRLEEEYAMARAKFEEGFKGINGIDGIIGRRPTTQQPMMPKRSWYDVTSSKYTTSERRACSCVRWYGSVGLSRPVPTSVA